MTNDQRLTTVLDALQLIRSENVGPVTYYNLLSYYGSPAEALRAIPELAKRGGRKRPIKACTRQAAEAELAATQAAGAQLITQSDAAYPPLLKEIADAPPVLAVKGQLEALMQREVVGMVGARNASAGGCQFARKIARELGEEQIVISSGLARGLDASAHAGAMASGTVGVIACGIDKIYPQENAGLYAEMAERGAIISENPLGMEPLNRSFPARNRIIAGMSRALLVIEAAEKSGSLITARNATEYGREVFAVPGSPLDGRSKGTNKLIKEGANLLESAEDVLAFLRNQQQQLFEPDAPAFDAPAPALPREDELAEARIILSERLGQSPVLVDEWLAQCQVRPHVMVAAMLEMELAGRLIRHPGGSVSLGII